MVISERADSWCLHAPAKQVHLSTHPLAQQIKQNVEVVQTSEAAVTIFLVNRHLRILFH